MNRPINYSIIIPHKNIPGLLQRCLNSIPRRDDVQIIVVDDNSDPDKVDFKNFPGLNDPFVEVVFTKEGKGAGYARNAGLTKAVGKWLLFADADDFFNYCINDIFDEYVNSDADIIYFKHNSIDSDTYTAKNRLLHFHTFIDKWRHSPQKADALLRYRHTSVWSRIHKTEFIKKNSISFDEVSIANDVTFAYLSGFYAASIGADPRALYCTTIRQGSIRHKKQNIEMELDYLYVAFKRYRFFKKNKLVKLGYIKQVDTLIKFYFLNKNYFHKAMNMLLNIGFTKGEILKLCICNTLIYFPEKKLLNFFSLPKKIILKLIR